jgi:diguanylate cyclase (GGDEF)-like protein
MLEPIASSPIALDIKTMFVIATSVTAMLGVFLLFAWSRDRVRALAWWGCAYLVGGFAVALWSVEPAVAPMLPSGMSNAFLFVACGMIWNAGRLFHGRPVLWGAMAAGPLVWLLACMYPDFVASLTARIVLSSVIISIYTYLTAMELWSERRKHLMRGWPSVVVPILHGAVFLAPIPLASILPDDRGAVTAASGWIAVFALEVMLYLVGSAFMVLVLTKERTVRFYKVAALTDDLTGLLNRRGFYEAAEQLMARRAKLAVPVCALVLDLDDFKLVNDRFGHATGDAALRVFGKTVTASTRTTDIIGRLGGEEFVALLPGPIEGAMIVAERVRAAFQLAGASVAGCPLNVTVSIGVASALGQVDIAVLLARADAALYRAKQNGRNRIEAAPPEEIVVAIDGELAPAAAGAAVARAAGVVNASAWHETKAPLSAA